MFKQKLRLAIFCGLILILSLSLLACSDDDEQEEIINKYDFELVVTDSNQNGINNAQVRFDDNTDETNSEGVVIFSDLEAGIYSLSVEADEYKKHEDNIEVGADAQNHKVKLEEKTIEVDGELIIVPSGNTAEDNGNLTLDYDILMSEYPTTFAEYEEYVKDIGAEMPDDEGWDRVSRAVINVSREDAVKYANWLSEQEGLDPAYDNNGELKDEPEYLEGYRLPNSKEWEYAARGGPNGEATTYAGSDEINEVGWYLNNSDSAMPVGEKKANELDLYDMSGNVEEWTDTQINSEYIACGGAWRYAEEASTVDATERFESKEKNDALGFRLVKTADFTLYSLDIESEGNGEVNIDPNREEYRDGDNITLRVEPATGYDFVAWSGDISGTEEEIEITVEEDMEIEAQFSKIVDIETAVKGEGKIEGEINDLVAGQKANLEAVSDDDWSFVEWNGDISGNNEYIEFIAEEDMEIIAEFTGAYNVSTTVEGEGDIEGETTIIRGEETRLKANPEAGWEFAGWSGDISGTEEEIEFTVEEDMEIEAQFERERYDLELISENGDINIEPELEEYKYETKVELKAEAIEGYNFVAWSGDVSDTEEEIEFTVEEDMEIKAEFKKIINIKTVIEGEGKIEGDTNVVKGEETTLEAVADDNWSFLEWSGDIDSTEEEITIKMDNNKEIIANFTEEEVNGMVLVEPGWTEEVYIDNHFYIGKYHVTQAEFEEVMGFNPSYFIDEDHPNLEGDITNRPVESVNWYDAVKFCNKLSKEEGLDQYYNISNIEYDGDNIYDAEVTENVGANGYRLPTSTEWGYAARGGKDGSSTTYAGSDELDKVGWYRDNSDKANSEGTNPEDGSGTMPVGEKEANELGLYDMSGNVYDWTNISPGSNYVRRRGGSWRDSAGFSRILISGSDTPSFSSNRLGFRLVRRP